MVLVKSFWKYLSRNVLKARLFNVCSGNENSASCTPRKEMFASECLGVVRCGCGGLHRVGRPWWWSAARHCPDNSSRQTKPNSYKLLAVWCLLAVSLWAECLAYTLQFIACNKPCESLQNALFWFEEINLY